MSAERRRGGRKIEILRSAVDAFRSRGFQKQETELVVIVTPYMVRPTARQNLVRSDEGLAPASDLKANFLGHLNRIYGKGRDLPAGGGLKGDYGFIVE